MNLKDRVKQTTTTQGSGTLTLDTTPGGYQGFSTLSNGQSTYYTIESASQWEVGVGTYNSGTLSRDTILDSSNSGSAINLTAARSTVFITYPAEKAVHRDLNDRVLVQASGLYFPDGTTQTTAAVDVAATGEASGIAYFDGTTYLTASDITYSPSHDRIVLASGGVEFNDGTIQTTAATNPTGVATRVAYFGSSNELTHSSLVFNDDSQLVLASGGIKFDDGTYQTTKVHTSGDIVGLLSPSQLGSGTPGASNFLRGDSSWQTVDLTPYVPYVGATGVVNLGSNDLYAGASNLGATVASSGTFQNGISSSGNVLMGGNKVTGLAAGTANGDAIRYEQLVGQYQPLDGDLTSLASASGTNTIYYRSDVDTWSGVTISTGLGFAFGTLKLADTAVTPGAYTNASITVDQQGRLTAASSGTAGVGGSTGSTDNAVLRADDTGGSTVQASAIEIRDLHTVSPNATVNYVSMAPIGGTTNVGVAIVPKGTGALSLAVPDGTATGGDVRGANAVDLQTTRTAATQVASGNRATIVGGVNNTASGTGATTGGQNNVVSNIGCTAFGSNNTVSGNANGFAFGYLNSVTGGEGPGALGYQCTVSGNHGAIATGYLCTTTDRGGFSGGQYARSYLPGQRAHAAGQFATVGDSQFTRVTPSAKTTDATPTEMKLRVLFGDRRVDVPSGKVLSALVQITGVKSDGSAVVDYLRRVRVKNVGGTTSLVGSVETIGSDHEDSAACDVAITADDTNDAIVITVTGIAAETWRWSATCHCNEVGYGT